jgi:hypothetical protein
MNILREIYDEKSKKERADFRWIVCRKCEWTTEQTFYNKLKGKSPLKKIEIEAIQKVNAELAL